MLVSSLAPSMAEIQAEDEEDDLFGDFKFVSFPNSNQNDQNDDDWGDFVTTTSPNQDFFTNSPQFQQPNGFSVTQNPNNGFDFDSRNNSSHHVESKKFQESPTSVVGSRWEIARGALPLSLFGDEEVESDKVDQENHGLQESFSSKKSGPNLGSGLSFNDLIGNLYSQPIQNGSSVYSNGKDEIKEIKVEPNSDVVVENGDLDFDEDDWEFKDAVSENRGGDSVVGMKKDENILDSLVIPTETWETSAKPITNPNTNTTTMSPKSSTIQESSQASLFGFSNNGQVDGDWFVAPQGNSYGSPISDNGFHFDVSANTANSWNTNTVSQPEHIATENGNGDYMVREDFEFDEGFGDFKDAASNIEASNFSTEQKEVVNVADQAGAEIKELSVKDEIQVGSSSSKENGKVPEKNRGALPLSIFGEEKPDSDESLFVQDVFLFKPTTSVRNGFNSQLSNSNLSVKDLIFDLYSQAENVSAVNYTREDTENGFSSDQGGFNSNFANKEDDFDESSWEFKAAFPENEAGHSSAVVGPSHIHQNLPTEKIMSFVDLYSRLKEEAGFIILHHLDDLKSAQEIAALSGEDAKAAALHEEIQTTYKKLHLENIVCEDDYIKENAPRNFRVHELLTYMEEPKFRDLDSEYHLSQRISLAEHNMESAIALFEHSISVLKILNLGSVGDVFNYTTTWSRVISTCAHELKHGASIWKQAVQKNVHEQILSKSQGQQYILALGEIYRVAEVLKVSVTFYKPWILSSLADPMDIFGPLEECNSVWLSSGIDGALRSLSDQVGLAYDGRAEPLLESIKSIHDLIDYDEPLLQSGVSLPEETCRLSLLPLKMVQGMKRVLWDEDHYFLTLANLWANLISCDPPKLPRIALNS